MNNKDSKELFKINIYCIKRKENDNSTIYVVLILVKCVNHCCV